MEEVGYIIPNQPIQAQIYANRMLMDEYNFAYVNQVNGVKMKSMFDEHLEAQEHQIEEQEENEVFLEKDSRTSSPPLYKGFIHPNPVNLSPIIAEINGKGTNFNVYI